MPEPQSRRGNVITEGAFEAPFTTPIYPCGVGGLNLAAAVDAVPQGQWTRLTNVISLPGETRQVTGRPGQTEVATAGATNVHSLTRMDLPATATYVRVVGAGQNLYLGTTGALAAIDSGYSGAPLTLLPDRPTLSGQPWTFVGDTAKMSKVRADGLVMPIGLPAPTFVPTLALGTFNRTTIATFSAADGTAPASWTANVGQYYTDPPLASGVPTTSATTDPDGNPAIQLNGNGLFFRPASIGFSSYWGIAAARNLNSVGGVAASDEDLIHLWLNLSRSGIVEEFRIYFVVSSVFSASIIPGTDPLGTANTDAYVKAFSQNDFAPFIVTETSQLNASETARIHAIRDEALKEEKPEDDRSAWAVTRATVDPSRTISQQAGAGSFQWAEYGILGVPLRRGDFQRIGGTPNRDWGNVTGIILWMKTTRNVDDVNIKLGGLYLFGGAGPDACDPETAAYDWRYTHYDPRTGAESNPSPVMPTASFLNPLRRGLVGTPVAYGDPAIRQRFYQRGGILVDDWYFAGENTADGAAFTNLEPDLALAAAGTVEIDHYQPVATVDDTGATVLAQPVPIIFGPYNGQLFALGDPYRPGYVYACLPGEPDHWPADLAHEVCPSSEQLMVGVMYGGQPYVASRDRWYVLYPNLTGASGMTSQPTGATRGVIARKGVALGAGAIWFVGEDGIYRTNGAGQELISTDIQPLFRGEVVNGYQPIDLTDEDAIALTVFDNELYFQYADITGARQCLVYQILTQQWRAYTFGRPTAALYAEDGDDGSVLLMGGYLTTGVYTHTGDTDDGDAIPANLRTASWDWGRPREEKLFGDQILDADLRDTPLVWQNFLNSETVTNPAQPLTASNGRTRTIFDSFGTVGPQKGRNLAIDVTWEASGPPPILYFVGTSLTFQPDLTINRVTNWDDLGHPDEVYLMGVTFDCDTGGEDRTIIIERDFNGQTSTVATLTVNCNGRHKQKFSWPALPANQVRIRPNDDCLAWLLYRADWIYQPEPPRIARWDIHFENGWDQYWTGLDLYCDTEGQTKTIIVEIDGTIITNPATGLGSFPVTAQGRQVVHLTLPTIPPLRGHVARFYALDDFPGLLYDHRWHAAPEPSEQHNWNQPFEIFGTQADKWLKAIVFEVDTFGQDKSVAIEADGVVAATLTVNASGRKVVEIAFPQILGRVWRILPTDSHPSRLYSLRPVFDEEPFQFTRWETQETNHGSPEFQVLIEAQVTLKSTADVTLSTIIDTNQLGARETLSYVIPSTGGAKQTRYVPFEARKGVLFKYLLTSAAPFFLYGVESHVVGARWVSGAPFVVKPFGDDDADPSRPMVNSTLAAARSGGVAS